MGIIDIRNSWRCCATETAQAYSFVASRLEVSCSCSRTQRGRPGPLAHLPAWALKVQTENASHPEPCRRILHRVASSDTIQARCSNLLRLPTTHIPQHDLLHVPENGHIGLIYEGVSSSETPRACVRAVVDLPLNMIHTILDAAGSPLPPFYSSWRANAAWQILSLQFGGELSRIAAVFSLH
ncbi:hypothetical protein WJX84_006567 [Apatococcus fuscideae]|uniref:Uncharacterized protein n=1 Tax=Apatococcus fuscideae TaxID=2026836 RepID=A0AAW1T5J5_9CHLO